VLVQLLAARDLMRASGSGRGEVKGWLRRQRARGVTWVGRKGEVRVVVEVAAERAKPVVQARAMRPAVIPQPVPPPRRRPAPPLPSPSDFDEPEEVDAVVYRSLDDRKHEVIDLLVEGGQQTRRQLQTALGWSRSTLRKVLEALIAEGGVTPSADPVRSPFRTYRLGDRAP
jgi:hypothetical protein